MSGPRIEGIDAVLSPRAVAIVGASADPARIGGRPIRYFKQTGFAGALYPINPNRAEIQGLKAYPSLADVPDGLDCVVVAVPPELALPALEQAAAKGARGAVIFTANYAEAGPEGVSRQQELVASARAKGMRLLGPNCLGVYNASSGHAATFGSFLEGERAPDAPIGIIGQSGAYASYIYVLLRKRGLGAARWLATGNEADIAVADAIGHMAGDDGVKVIAAYVEGVKHGPAFLGALAMARAAGKPVVLIKVGRSETGAAAAMSHTASLAGDDQVFDAVVRQMGGYRARTTEELIDVVEALARRGPLAGNRLGVLTISGGAGVLMADDAEAAGLVLPVMPAATQARLKAENPLGSFVNPV
ncbi:MAG: acetate--CoA ligase family protein, partial [Phreatobacter sp.]